MSLYHRECGYTRCFSQGRGRGYRDEIALCSRCQQHAAYWLEKKGNRQRYYCNECVKVAKAWKEREKTKGA